MIEATLEKIGLTKSETKIYLSLLKSGEASVSRIAKDSNLHRRNVYDVLSTLLDKGLICITLGEYENKYGAVSPEKLLELVASKRMALESIMPELKKLQSKVYKQERAFIYKGVDGFKKYLEDIINVGGEVLCVGAKGGWGDPKFGEIGKWFMKERIKHSIKVYNLFDYEMKEYITKNPPPYAKLGEYRFLPKYASTNSALDVFGDRVVTFTGLYKEKIDEDLVIFTLISPDLAASWRTWFKCMWDACKPAKS